MVVGSDAGDRIARDVVDHLHEGCQVIDFGWHYVYVNDTAVAQAQQPRDRLMGRTMMECYPGIEQTPMFALLRRCMEQRTHERMDNEFDFPDGTKGYFELRVLPMDSGVCVLSIDVTERKRSEAALARTESQLQHAQKMEAVGRLAGGVAHDFNNLLSVVLSYGGLLLTELAPDDPRRVEVQEICKAGRRAAELTRQLLTFSRHRLVAPGALDLNQVVGALDRMIARLLGTNITVTILPGDELGRVIADAGQMEQVLMNLVVNARDAMPDGGQLTISTSNAVLDEEYALAHHGVIPGQYVKLTVTDTGSGMSRETQARIFEPFFTTKEAGRGTGLGLATVFGIVEKSGGHVWVYSEPGRGTTFKIYLPQTQAAASVVVGVATDADDDTRGDETILLVEDDDQVRASASGVLRRAGYQVLEACGLTDALRVSAETDGPIHLLLTDVMLAGATGPALLVTLRETRPALPVLYMSGYADEAIVRHGVLDAADAYIEKPLTVEALRRRVRDVLGAASRPGF